MEHHLKTRYIDYLNLEDKRIKNKEVLEIIRGADEIKIGTQVAIDIIASRPYILEVVEIDRNKIWWEIKI